MRKETTAQAIARIERTKNAQLERIANNAREILASMRKG